MPKQKTIPELKAEITANERQLAQLRHKQQKLENRRSYYEKGDRRKRAHRLITRGAAIESVAPLAKEVAVDLLKKVKAKIAGLNHWTDKQETKATIDNLIRGTLWAEFPECYDELSISAYRQKIYAYVYTRYKDAA